VIDSALTNSKGSGSMSKTATNLMNAARYWRQRAQTEANLTKQALYDEVAATLEHCADVQRSEPTPAADAQVIDD
jgi:hypothetical protein